MTVDLPTGIQEAEQRGVPPLEEWQAGTGWDRLGLYYFDLL